MSRRLTIALAGLGAAMILLVIGYLVLIALDGAPLEASRNVSQAMRPTILVGDRFTWQRLVDGPDGHVKRADVVIHAWPPDPSKRFIKRVVGMPGDTLSMVRGVLHVNGQPLREPYAWLEDPAVDPVSADFAWQEQFLVRSAAMDTARYVASRDNWGPLALPPRMYFVLGDNRDNSLDSRYWGFVPSEQVLGEVRRVYFSTDSTGRIRWRRLGRRVN